MRKQLYFLTAMITLICLSTSFSFAQKPGTTGAEFLKIPAGARQVGLGSTFVGIGDDVNSLFWNPGGIATLGSWEFSAMHNAWLSDLRFDSFGLTFPIFGKKNHIGVMAGILSMPSWDNTGGIQNKVSAQDVFAGFAFAHRFWRGLNVGGSLKYIRRELANYDATAMAFDLGAVYRHGNWLTLGGSMQNFGDQIKFLSTKASLPLVLRGGGSLRPFWGKMFDFLVAMDGAYFVNDDLQQLNVGTELCLMHIFSLRAGYQFDKTLFSLTSGVGVRHGIFSIDYSYTPFESDYFKLSHAFATHQISVTVKSNLPISFVSHYPGPLKNDFLKREKNLKKIQDKLKKAVQNLTDSTKIKKAVTPKKLSHCDRLMLQSEQTAHSDSSKIKKLKKKERELTQFLQDKVIFYKEPSDSITFKWEKTIDPNPGDSVHYQICLALVDTLPGKNIREKTRNVETGKVLCDTRIEKKWRKFYQVSSDTIGCTISQRDSVILNQGRYAWWVIAYDLSGHQRKSCGGFRYMDLRFFKSPQQTTPKMNEEIQINKWQFSPGTGLLDKEKSPQSPFRFLSPQDIPGGGLVSSEENTQSTNLKKYPVTFKWSPATLGFGIVKSTVRVFSDTTQPVIIDSSIVWNDSTGVVMLPIPEKDTNYYWDVVAQDATTKKTKSTPFKWAFILHPVEIKAELAPDTLYVKHLIITESDVPYLPVFFFEAKSPALYQDSRLYLDTLKIALIELVKDNPDVKLELSGFCDRQSDGVDQNAAEGLGWQRANRIRESLLVGNLELESQIVVKRLLGPDIFRARIIEKEAINDLDRAKIQAENRRVEVGAILTENTALASINSFPELLRNGALLTSIDTVLNRNKDVILIIKGRDFESLNQLRQQFNGRIHPENIDKVYCIEQTNSNRNFEVKLSGDKIIYRPLPPKVTLSEYDSSKIDVTVKNISVPCPFDWKLEISSEAMMKNGIPGQLIEQGSVTTNYQSTSLSITSEDENVRQIMRDASESYKLLLTITPYLGGNPVQIIADLLIMVTEEQINREQKIIIQYIFDTTIAESEFLETQVEDFAKMLLAKNPDEIERIIVTGHTCNIGSDARNRELSQERAEKAFTSLKNRLLFYSTQREYRARALQLLQKLEGQYDGCSFCIPYGTQFNLTQIKSLINCSPFKVEDANLTPRPRSMNRRAQIDIVWLKKMH